MKIEEGYSNKEIGFWNTIDHYYKRIPLDKIRHIEVCCDGVFMIRYRNHDLEMLKPNEWKLDYMDIGEFYENKQHKTG